MDEISVWQLRGQASLLGDRDPLAGITATCSNGFNLAIAPRVGPPSQFTSSVAGYKGVFGSYGLFLDSVFGIGGTGPSSFSWSCPLGLKVLGLHVSMESPTPSDPLVLKRVRVYCGSPTACSGPR